MDVTLLKEEFYQNIVEALKEFSTGKENDEVYALLFDCDFSVGAVHLRYRNREQFTNKLDEYLKYQQKYGWAVYGLHGCEYDPGDFEFIEYKKSPLVRRFTASYYYHEIGDYYGEGEPMEEIKDDYREIFQKMILNTVNRLKGEIETLGLRVTDNFILFHCDHDQSFEDRDRMMEMTVEKEMMEKLL